MQFLLAESSWLKADGSPLHHIHDQSGQRLREEVGGFVRHPLAGGGHILHLAHLRCIQQQGSGACSVGRPIQRFVVVFGVEDGFLFLLRWTELGDDQLLQ